MFFIFIVYRIFVTCETGFFISLHEERAVTLDRKNDAYS